jgi:hypothetical protein
MFNHALSETTTLLVAMHAAGHLPQSHLFVSCAGLQDMFRRKGAQELHILKNANGVLKPVSACSCMQPTDSVITSGTVASMGRTAGAVRAERRQPAAACMAKQSQPRRCEVAAHVGWLMYCMVCVQGTMTLLLGGPGSGKSTLMKVLSGRLKGKNFTVSWRCQQLGCAGRSGTELALSPWNRG